MTQDDGTIGPQEAREFLYLGDFIPNQVNVQNLSADFEAQFIMQAVDDGVAGWQYYGEVPAGQTVAVLVHWPAEARVTNRGERASIQVSGDGIFPKT